MRTAVPLILVILFLAGCGEERLPAPSAAESPDAATVAAALEQDCRAFATLPPEERVVAEAAFGPRLERDLQACRGTRYENVPLYLLANWTLAQGGDEAATRTLVLLHRLERLPSPAYRNFGRNLMVQALLVSGQTAEARRQADELALSIPELGQLAKEQIAFHELVGSPAPALPGVHAGGPAVPPAAMFVLVEFVGAADAYATRQVAPWTALAKDGRLAVVVIATSGDLLRAAAASTDWTCTVRWVRPGNQDWIQAWRLPSVPASVLLGPGPDRTVLAVQPGPQQVRQLLR